MIARSASLFVTQNKVAIQRLTALWAFTESGLGGIMHALQIPFTGLLVGGMAIIMICMIAEISKPDYRQVLKSAMIVLIVKAMVSPHTPFPAYLAVSFQAIMGYSLFSLLRVNMISITLLSIVSMLESAMQKLLILTLFFGESLWKAADGMVALLAKQFGLVAANGSYWIIGFYIGLYTVGGFLIAWLAYTSINGFHSQKTKLVLAENKQTTSTITAVSNPDKKKRLKKIWILIGIMAAISILLYFLASDSKKGWLAVFKTISWTVSAILVWYLIIGPLFTKAIQRFLKKKQSRNSDEVLQVLSFIPVLRQLTSLAWQQSKQRKGVYRWMNFVSLLIHNTLTYTEPAT